MRPRLLDLFCGAGGASMGYSRAGFDVVGVDIAAQKNYPFEFHQADAMTYPLEGFDVIHASPPCQAFSSLRHMPGAGEYPDYVAPIRARIEAWPYVIENVPGAPLRPDVMLCAGALGIRLPDGARLQRHRLFETSIFILGTGCVHDGLVLGVYGDIRRSRRSGMLRGTKASWVEAQQLMGIDWMTADELTEAIPPAYTYYIGTQLLAALESGHAGKTTGERR